MRINNIGRDKKKIEDVYSLRKTISQGAIISIQEDLRIDWTLHGYFHRLGKISLDSKYPFCHKYVLVEKNFVNELLSGYQKKTINLNLYDLYELK